jgi:hypothetical protein
MVSIGISNDDIRTMQRHPQIWLANAATDFKLAGIINMRMLAAKLAGEIIQDTYFFSPQAVKTADLNRSVNMANLPVMIPDWGDDEGLFNHYQWMIELKAAEGKFIQTAAP